MFGHTTPLYPRLVWPNIGFFGFFGYFQGFFGFFWFLLVFCCTVCKCFPKTPYCLHFLTAALPKRSTFGTFGQLHCQNAIHSALLEYCIAKRQYIRHFWNTACPKRNTFGTFGILHCQIAVHSALVDDCIAKTQYIRHLLTGAALPGLPCGLWP